MQKYSYSGWELSHFDKACNFRNYQYDLIKSYIKNSIAEIGPGTGLFLEKYILLTKKKIHLFEPTKKFCLILENKFKNKVKIFNSYFISKKKYNTIIYLDVIEHIFDDKHEILKAYNNLARNGLLIINVPAFKILFSRFDKDVNHYRRYQKNTFSKTLNELNIKEYNMIYYDSVGFFLSFLSKFFSKNYKKKFGLKIKIWDKLIILSKIIDKITFNCFGKSLLVIIKKA
jgi:hypothetical protein